MADTLKADFESQGFKLSPAVADVVPERWECAFHLGGRTKDRIMIHARQFELKDEARKFSMDCVEFSIIIETRSGFSQTTKYVVPEVNVTQRYLAGVRESAEQLYGFAKTLTQ